MYILNNILNSKFWIFIWFIFIIFYLYLSYFNKFNYVYKNVKNLRSKKIYWVDIWEINTNITSLEKIENLPWNMYYKYKLSMINTWHILEDRILIFFIFIIILL